MPPDRPAAATRRSCHHSQSVLLCPTCDLQEQQKRNDARKSAILYSRSVFSPYSLRIAYAGIRTLYVDSAEIRTLIWSPERVRVLRSTDAADRCTDAGGGSTERVRSQYGLTLSAESAAYVKHEITLKIRLRISADRGGNAQTQCGYSAHTVRIPRGSRRIEHPPRYAASVRRCERGIIMRYM